MKSTLTSYENYFENRHVPENFYQGYRIPHYIEVTLPSARAARIVDIGCGLGQTMKALRILGYSDVTGLDVAPQAVTACQRAGLHTELISTIGRYLPRAERKKFDYAIMSHVLEHIPKEQIIPTLKHIRTKLLRSGGKLFIAVPNAQSNTGCYWAYEDFTHSTIFTAGSLEFVLRSAGYNGIEFLNDDGTALSRWPVRLIRKSLLKLYRANAWFWNKVTGSSFHLPSRQIFTYDIQVVASAEYV